MKQFSRHWCNVKAEKESITFDVFGGKDKRINKMSDSYSDWIINSGGVYRFKKGQLIMYYHKDWLGEEHTIEDDLAGTPEKELHPEDFVFIAPLEIDLKVAKMPIDQQRYAINKAQYAAFKFETPEEMSRYLKAAMMKKFGSFWEVFIETKLSHKKVKRACEPKNLMNFSVNDLSFIVCRVLR
ncbi:casein kinase I isoform gamma-3 [Sarcoptes scabiei]|nr:hypothetical protein QR98_0017840 [Sarcoptes scabiei]UXI15744.1 casein kinase I isoform gamma-3 [Sarcoptes scabiei]